VPLFGRLGSIRVEDALAEIAPNVQTNAVGDTADIVREGRAAHGVEQMAFEGLVTLRGRSEAGEKVGPIPREYWKDHGFDQMYLMPGSPGSRTERKTLGASHQRFVDLELPKADVRRAVREARRNRNFGKDDSQDGF
jgi:hypothetical protein